MYSDNCVILKCMLVVSIITKSLVYCLIQEGKEAWPRKMISARDFPGGSEGFKDLVFSLLWLRSLLWCGFNSWPGNFHMLGHSQKKSSELYCELFDLDSMWVLILDCPLTFFIFIFYNTVIYRVLSISTIQQSDPVIHIYIHTFFFSCFSIGLSSG